MKAILPYSRRIGNLAPSKTQFSCLLALRWLHGRNPKFLFLLPRQVANCFNSGLTSFLTRYNLCRIIPY